MKKFRSVLFLAVLCSVFAVLTVLRPLNAHAQNVATSQDSTITDVDGAFMQARELAFDGEREEARELAYAILEVAPEYLDVRILVARTYSWDGRHEEARRELAKVFEESPRNREAFLAAIDNERWAEERQEAMRLAQEAVSHYPNDEALLTKQAQVFREAGDERQAERVLNRVIELNPSSTQARELRDGLAQGPQRWRLSATYTQDQFTDHFDTFHTSKIGLSRLTNAGPLTARLSYASRFGTEDWQGELEMYPTLGRGWYAYLNAGYSGSILFPEVRTGA
ncbi:MAG: YaiO family outer membrane beta-barrel protein, partial [Bacteroidota bacterium]